MTRLPAVTARQLVAVAEKLGFVFDRQKGRHAVYVRTNEHGRTLSLCRSTKDEP